MYMKVNKTNMKKLNDLLLEISQLITNLETNYPEITKNIVKNNAPIYETESNTVRISDLEEYLNSLKTQLHGYMKMHNATNIKG